MNRFVLLITMSVFAIMDCLADEYDSLRLVEVRSKMDSLCVHEPAFMESVDISVGQMRLSELLRTIAKMKKVNLSVRDNFDCIVSCNFTSSPIDDLIVFLCSEYELDIDIYGNIVSIFQYVAPIVPDPPVIINCDADFDHEVKVVSAKPLYSKVTIFLFIVKLFSLFVRSKLLSGPHPKGVELVVMGIYRYYLEFSYTEGLLLFLQYIYLCNHLVTQV